MLERRVALLRGVNVGTAQRVAMADLRALFAELGYDDVRTLLNSGNVVFTLEQRRAGDVGARLERAIAERLGVAARVTVLSGAELARAVRENPLGRVAHDPSRLLIVFPRGATALQRLAPLLEKPWSPEALALGQRAAYLWCADGIAAGRLWSAVDRALGDDGTARNLATATKLLSLVGAA